MNTRVKYYLSEFTGTFLFMLNGISAISLNFGTRVMQEAITSSSLRLLLTGVLFAGGATLIVYSPIGRISGSHLNPAISLSFFLEGKLKGLDLFMFSLMQIAGSIAAALISLLLWSESARAVNVGMTLPGSGHSIFFVFFVEVFATFLLVSLVFFFLHRKTLTKFTGLAAGSLVAIIVFLTVPISGTGLNPARSIGPAVVALNFSYLWLYIAAPLLG
ncbi:MAG: aquaporin family protein, partial [Deltaproteobacteria bacterium]|nr:aquaporin family protein [Deltaproteobacteria bacterium]